MVHYDILIAYFILSARLFNMTDRLNNIILISFAIGSIDLPDAHNDVKWRKAGDNGSLDDEARIRQEKISR